MSIHLKSIRKALKNDAVRVKIGAILEQFDCPEDFHAHIELDVVDEDSAVKVHLTVRGREQKLVERIEHTYAYQRLGLSGEDRRVD